MITRSLTVSADEVEQAIRPAVAAARAALERQAEAGQISEVLFDQKMEVIEGLESHFGGPIAPDRPQRTALLPDDQWRALRQALESWAATAPEAAAEMARAVARRLAVADVSRGTERRRKWLAS